MPSPCLPPLLPGAAPAGHALPNNLGPTLLIVGGMVMLPLIIGAPLVLIGLAGVRSASGAPALPSLRRWLEKVRLPAGNRRTAALGG